MQPRGHFGKGSYKRREEQIVWKVGGQNFREGTQSNRGKQRLERDPNTIDVNRGI